MRATNWTRRHKFKMWENGVVLIWHHFFWGHILLVLIWGNISFDLKNKNSSLGPIFESKRRSSTTCLLVNHLNMETHSIMRIWEAKYLCFSNILRRYEGCKVEVLKLGQLVDFLILILILKFLVNEGVQCKENMYLFNKEKLWNFESLKWEFTCLFKRG